jgi:hypothetical protein
MTRLHIIIHQQINLSLCKTTQLTLATIWFKVNTLINQLIKTIMFLNIINLQTIIKLDNQEKFTLLEVKMEIVAKIYLLLKTINIINNKMHLCNLIQNMK